MYKRVDELYPLYTEALIQVCLVRNKSHFSILSTCVKNKTVLDQNTDKNNQEDNQTIPIQYDNRSTYFTKGYCDTWKYSFILRLIKKLKKKYRLS